MTPAAPTRLQLIADAARRANKRALRRAKNARQYAAIKADPEKYAAKLATNRESRAANGTYARQYAKVKTDPKQRAVHIKRSKKSHAQRMQDPVKHAAYLEQLREWRRQQKLREASA